MYAVMKNAEKIWSEITDRIAIELSSVSYEAWFHNVEPLFIKDNSLILLCKNRLVKKMMSVNYNDIIHKAALSARSIITSFTFILDEEVNDYEVQSERQVGNIYNFSYENTFNNSYTFDEYVVGNSNEFVYAAANAVAEKPGCTHNPLFIYGGVGLGKTHLLHAIGLNVQKNNPKLKVLYVTTESFTNELIYSIRNSSAALTKQFREKYRSVDLLLIDDIQFLSGKTSTQDALFHIFNDLYNNKKQIVLTSDRPLSETNAIEERLISRFSWGLIADIQAPSIETRIAILQKKSFKYHYNIDYEVLLYIAEKSINNVRILEGMLNTVVFYIQLNSSKLPEVTQLQLAKEALKDFEIESQEQLTLDYIIDVVCAYFNISRALIEGKKKNKDIVEPRQIAMYLITELLPQIPLMTIGNSFSGRDHTTVMYARDKMADLFIKDDRIKKIIVDIKAQILNK